MIIHSRILNQRYLAKNPVGLLLLMKHVDAHHILFVLKKEKEKEGGGKEDREGRRLEAIETYETLYFAKYSICTTVWKTLSVENSAHMKKGNVDCSVFIDIK